MKVVEGHCLTNDKNRLINKQQCQLSNKTSQLHPRPSNGGTDSLLRSCSFAPLLAAADVQDGWNILVEKRLLGCQVQSVCVVQSFVLPLWQRVATLLSGLEQKMLQIVWLSCCLGPFECLETCGAMQAYNVEAVASIMKKRVSNDSLLSKYTGDKNYCEHNDVEARGSLRSSECDTWSCTSLLAVWWTGKKLPSNHDPNTLELCGRWQVIRGMIFSTKKNDILVSRPKTRNLF